MQLKHLAKSMIPYLKEQTNVDFLILNRDITDTPNPISIEGNDEPPITWREP